jgi:hypothetical protein
MKPSATSGQLLCSGPWIDDIDADLPKWRDIARSDCKTVLGGRGSQQQIGFTNAPAARPAELQHNSPSQQDIFGQRKDAASKHRPDDFFKPTGKTPATLCARNDFNTVAYFGNDNFGEEQ